MDKNQLMVQPSRKAEDTKKRYERPLIEVIELDRQSLLLVDSPFGASSTGFRGIEREEWDE